MLYNTAKNAAITHFVRMSPYFSVHYIRNWTIVPTRLVRKQANEHCKALNDPR
jgi:hypothetical protein